MDLLKTQLERIQRQLAGLNATQRMLTAALTAIMIITVIWWGKYAGEPETVPLLSQAFSPADLGRIEERLDQKGIHYSVSGDKLLVPTDRRMEILSDLTYSRLMPHNTQEGFDAIIKQSSPFDSEVKQEKIWKHGKEMLLSQIIGSFPDVLQSDVIIDTSSSHPIGGGSDSSATVNISMRDGAKPSQKLVDAAADAVAGAQSGLAYNRIKIVVNGMAQKVRDSETPLAEGPDQLALLQQNEASGEQRIRQAYMDIPGLLVSVTMKLNTTTIQTEKHDFDGKAAVSKAIESTSETDTATTPPSSGGEGGAVANTGVSAITSSASTGSSNHEKTNDRFQNFVPETHTVSRTPAGDATPVGATVRVPLSYFSRLFQSRDPSGSTAKEPSYAQLQPLITEQLTRMREGVAKCVMLSSPTDVSIDTYVDSTPSMAAAPVAASSGSAVSLLVGGHAKEIALGLLAVMSLFMASMMVRKGSPIPVQAMSSPAQAEREAVHVGSEAGVGESTASNPMLDGMELDEDAVKATQMVEQVSTMVRENPDAAATLVKRWLNRA